MPQMFWQPGAPAGMPFHPMYQPQYAMQPGYAMQPHNGAPQFMPPGYGWPPGAGGHAAPAGFGPAGFMQPISGMYGSPASPVQYEQMHRTILQQQQQAHQLQFQMQTAGQMAPFGGGPPPAVRAGPPPAARFGGPGGQQGGPPPYGPRPMQSLAGPGRGQPNTPPSRAHRARANVRSSRTCILTSTPIAVQLQVMLAYACCG